MNLLTAPILKIELPMQGNSFAPNELCVYAGSFIANCYRLEEEGYYAVNLTAEGQHLPHSLSIPIRDFDVPQGNVLNGFEDNLRTMLQAALDGEKVFFGCMGGVGRTGIVLACLYKVFGVENTNIVYYTRQNLDKHAIETPEQINFVKNFNPTNLKLDFEEMYLNKLIEQSALNPENESKVDFSLITKIRQFMARQPGNLNFVSSLLKHSKHEEINNLINNNNLNPSSDEYNVGAQNINGNLLDLAYEYNAKPLIKDLIVSGLKPINQEYENNMDFKDKFFVKLLRLSSRIRKINIINSIGIRPNV